jgi:hypothetical protein
MDEDMILPDGFQESLPSDTESTEQLDIPNESETVDPEAQPEATEETETETETPQQQLLKIKFNREEKEISIEEAKELAQKGLNYDKTVERLQALETDPRLSFIEELANQHGMTPQEYMEAVQQQREQSRIDELVSQGISEEVAQEMLENRKFRDQYEAEKKAKAEEEKKNAEFGEFFNYFREANGREYVPNQDKIPENVWESVNQGVPLKFAYMAHENSQLRTQLSTLKQNQSNAQKAPVGSVTAHGGNEIAAEDDFMRGFNSI